MFRKPRELKQEISIEDYALFLGYRIDKKKSSTKWLILKHPGTGDRIRVGKNSGASGEDLYDSLSDPANDKGDLLDFCANRLNGNLAPQKRDNRSFYRALTELNRFIGTVHDDAFDIAVDRKNRYLKRKESLAQRTKIDPATLQQEITDYRFLRDERMISKRTIDHPYFKGRVFNTYFQMPNGHEITNTGFAKVRSGSIVGMEVRNTGFKSILGDDSAWFWSNLPGEENGKDPAPVDVLFYGETAIDVLSYFEMLNGMPGFDPTKNYCFASSGGNIYKEKISALVQELDSMPITGNTKFVSITDNDGAGFYYDYHLTTVLMDKFHTPVTFQRPSRDFHTLDFELTETVIAGMDGIQRAVDAHNGQVDENVPVGDRYGKYIVAKTTREHLVLNIPAHMVPTKGFFPELLKALGAERFYIPHKPKYPDMDWNDALRGAKQRYRTETASREANSVERDDKKYKPNLNI